MTVTFNRNGTIITLKVAEAFTSSGYRVLCKKYGRITAWVGVDGESDMIYNSEEQAENAILDYCTKLIKMNMIEVFTVARGQEDEKLYYYG